MNPSKKYHLDKRTLELLERLTVPFAVYQFIDKRVITLALSDGFCQSTKNELTKEMIEKAIQCETVEELMAYAKSEGVNITREETESEAYLAELSECEIKDGQVRRISGGTAFQDGKPWPIWTTAGCGTNCAGVLWV